ncbi:MAG TPA: glycosyltransferase [Candidatus Dormibacteraeota bacterium]|nr:glycosyltransferase [Candidatus Dormibacteraeota bacterium]
MRIVFIAPYQGLGVVARRPIVTNRSLASAQKLQLLTASLHANGHSVEVISQGEIVPYRWRFYPGFREPQPFHPQIPVHYASLLPWWKVKPLWSCFQMLRLLRARNRVAPFDLAFVWNMQHPQVVCADYALRRLNIPVILQYEDDTFVSIGGEQIRFTPGHREYAQRMLKQFSGCCGCSPWLLSQLPSDIPKLLLRGALGKDIVECSKQVADKKDWVLFSGTHAPQYAIPALIAAWQKGVPAGWELHITGEGDETPQLRKLAEKTPTIHFHGLVPREQLVRLMTSAKICMNPHQLSKTPGNVFAFKIIEYLGAGAHVITTRMGEAEEELERGITYMPDNSVETIYSTLNQVIQTNAWQRTAADHVLQTCGPDAISKSLNELVHEVKRQADTRNGRPGLQSAIAQNA